MRSVSAAWLAAIAVAAAGTAPACAQDEAPAPSFDCTIASAPLETLICADAALADLDRVLMESYQAALATRVGEAQLLLREEQRAWAESRAPTCGVDGDPAIEVEDAIGCLIALYRTRIAELRPEGALSDPVPQSGYGWLMGDWTVAAIRKAPADAARAEVAKAQLGRAMRFAEAPVTTPGGAVCSFPRYSAEPGPGPQFGDLSDYPAAVMVRVSCVGIALLDVVRLTDRTILVGEGEVVYELERRR